LTFFNAICGQKLTSYNQKLVAKYSEFINFPIYLWTSHEEEEEVPVEEEEEEESVNLDKEEGEVRVNCRIVVMLTILMWLD